MGSALFVKGGQFLHEIIISWGVRYTRFRHSLWRCHLRRWAWNAHGLRMWWWMQMWIIVFCLDSRHPKLQIDRRAAQLHCFEHRDQNSLTLLVLDWYASASMTRPGSVISLLISSSHKSQITLIHQLQSPIVHLGERTAVNYGSIYLILD
jgi:hypothetical protein